MVFDHEDCTISTREIVEGLLCWKQKSGNRRIENELAHVERILCSLFGLERAVTRQLEFSLLHDQ